MLAFYDTKSTVTAGALISGGCQFRAKEEDAKDITIKRSDIYDSRLISWRQSHPIKDERAQSPDEMDEGIYIHGRCGSSFWA
jgi:hypothetical protein